MAPVVLTGILSDPNVPADVAETLAELPPIKIRSGYWRRAGALRAQALIAQICIDRGIPLLTRDRDFQAFADAEGLALV